MSQTVIDGAMSMARRYEGMRLKAYLCPAGVWTIGAGATGRGIGPGLVWTLEQAIERLERDCVRSLGAAYKHCPILYSEPDARAIGVGDFVFNLGEGRLIASTMRRRINEGNWTAAAEEAKRWVWGGGKKLPGLVLRRAEMAELLLG
jgi:lysozyme